MTSYKRGGWVRYCSSCGSSRTVVKGDCVFCENCRKSEVIDPWSICPDCRGPLEQSRVITVGVHRTTERRCKSCGFRATTESKIVYEQYSDSERRPGAHKHMRNILDSKKGGSQP